MALLLSRTPLTALSPFPSSLAVNATATATGPISRLPTLKSIHLPPNSLTRLHVVTPLTKTKTSAAASDAAPAAESGEPPSETEKAVVPVDQLPLESKEKERMEQKLRMKLAKKIRLRRKRLLRKRKLRKKGRWPPSKMKKLKNV